MVLNGQPWIQEAGGPIDDFTAGAGYRADMTIVPVSQVQVEVVSNEPVEIEVEAFFLNHSLAPPQRIKVEGTNSLLRWGTGGVYFDRVEFRAVRDSPGFGLDNLSLGGKMASRPVLCRDAG